MANIKEMTDVDSEGVYMMSIEEFQSRPPKTSNAPVPQDKTSDSSSHSDWATRKPGYSPSDVETAPEK